MMEGGEKFDLSLRLAGISRDLLQSRCSKGIKREVVEEEDEIELSLGLSMNGRFGVDPSSKKIKRSSSIANLVFTAESSSSSAAQLVKESELVRTRSLPTAPEEEWCRRKEWHTMRRLEARKKRIEKLKNVRAMKDNGNGNGFHEPMPESGGFPVMISSDGSSETPSSGSSGASDLPVNGTKQQDSKLQQRKGCTKNGILDNGETDRSLREMPFVSTRGEGANKVEGFLYRYQKGEEVRIVCVCHGLFLSPAEFVKHGGGGDVEHPLKHIVVNPFPIV